ncbi:MAG: hypothetical protein QXG10_00595 [Candidatus Hadarchaeales archaeon]
MPSQNDITNVAAILVTIASLFAAISWITSGGAGSEASSSRMSALGFMMLRLECTTEASNSRVQAQSYLTQAGMYLAYSEKEDNLEVKGYLENLWYQSVQLSNFYIEKAENAEARGEEYYGAYENAISRSLHFSSMSEERSTAALLFNVSAIIASCAVLFRKRFLIYMYLPFFAVGAYYLLISVI